MLRNQPVFFTANVNVNVRSGPGTQFRVIEIVMQGEEGDVVGTSPDDKWWVVPMPPDHPHYKIGFVSKSVTTLSNPENTELSVVTPPLLHATVYVEPPAEGAPAATVIEPAVVRTGPGKTYPIFGLSSTGPKVEVIGKSEAWWAIKLPANFAPEGVGWINQVYLQTENTSDVEEMTDIQAADPDARPTAPGSGQAAAKLLEDMDVRSGPGTGYSSITEEKAGSIMAIIGISADGEWWVVSLPTQTAAVGHGWIEESKTHSSKADTPSAYIRVKRAP